MSQEGAGSHCSLKRACRADSFSGEDFFSIRQFEVRKFEAFILVLALCFIIVHAHLHRQSKKSISKYWRPALNHMIVCVKEMFLGPLMVSLVLRTRGSQKARLSRLFWRVRVLLGPGQLTWCSPPEGGCALQYYQSSNHITGAKD